MPMYDIEVSGHAEGELSGGTLNADFSFSVTLEAEDRAEAEGEAQDLAYSVISQLEITSYCATAYEAEA